MAGKAPILQEQLKRLSQVRLRTPRLPFLITFVILAVAIIAAWTLAEGASQRNQVAWRDLRQSQAAVSQTEKVFSLLQDAETGQRGYILTGDPEFLAPYRNAESLLGEAMADMTTTVTREDPAQAARVGLLRDQVAAKLDEMAAVIRVRDTLGPATATRIVARGEGKTEMDAIRATIGNLGWAEARAAEAATQRYESATASARLLTIGLVAGLGVFLLTAAVLAELFFRWKDGLTVRYVDMARRRISDFDEASDAILVVNTDGGLEAMNAAAERLFGREKDAIAGIHVNEIMDLVPTGDEAFLTRLEATHGALATAPVRELLARRPDGGDAPVDVTVRPMHMDEGLYIGVYARDISDRKRVERLKDEFVSTVSHELRTPLTSIAGSLGLLVGTASSLPEGPARLIAIAHANCQRLIRLINDMLDVEKIESGKMKFEMGPLTLSEVAQRSIDAVRGYADQLGVEIRFSAEDDDLPVRGDLDRLVQVGANLISNAVKFSKTGDCVKVSVLRKGRLARLSMCDTGPGIPDEFRSRIFTKFAQADSSDTRQKGGTGLGLVIAKELVDRHGGRLWFESEVDHGSRFHVDLPLSDAAKPSPASPSAQDLLVCEDDADIAELLRRTLEADGFTVDVVTTSAEATAALGVENTYRALVLDLILPDGNGLGLIQALRARQATRDLPIVVVSAQAEHGRETLGGGALNVVDWMEKPIDMARLRRAVMAALARNTQGRPLVLHVDDDHDILRVTATALALCGEIASVESLAAARAFLARRTPDLVILDLALGDGSGLELLADLNDEAGRPIPVLVFSAHDPEQLVLGRVAQVMTKSRTSLTTLAEAVTRMISPSSPPVKRRLAS
jgi:PAS domain S-box-containing protein